MAAGLQPVLVHLSKNKDGKFTFNPVSINLMVELAKSVFALLVLFVLVSWCGSAYVNMCVVWWAVVYNSNTCCHSLVCTSLMLFHEPCIFKHRVAAHVQSTSFAAQGTGRPGAPMYRSVKAFIADARHNALLAVPAGLYAINNYLKFAMQLYFRPTTTKMLSNLKIFTIALLMRTVLGRKFNVIQWEALFLLVAGTSCRQE